MHAHIAYNFGCHLWVHCGRAFRIHSSLKATSIWSLSTPENLFGLQWRTNVYTIGVAFVNLCFETLLWALERIHLNSSSKCSWTKVLFHFPFITSLPLPVISIVSRWIRLHCSDWELSDSCNVLVGCAMNRLLAVWILHPPPPTSWLK